MSDTSSSSASSLPPAAPPPPPATPAAADPSAAQGAAAGPGPDVQVMCWNVQKLNGRKAADHGAAIAAHIASAVDFGRPYVVCILENQRDRDTVTAHLRNNLGGPANPGMEVKVLPMGGSASTKENLITITGGGATVTGEAAWTEWADPFDRRMKETVETYKTRKLVEFYSGGREMRRTTETNRTTSVDAVDGKSAKDFRNPIELTVSAGGISGMKMLVMHAPGPQDSSVADEHPYARSYVENVLEKAAERGVSVVVGDMNVYGDVHQYGYRSLTPDNETTTLNRGVAGSADGARISRLDRVFVLPGVQADTEVKRSHITRAVSDHFSTYTRVAASVGPLPVAPPPPVYPAANPRKRKY